MPVLYVLDNTLGAAFIGVIVAATLHGVSIVQAWYYFTHQNDAWPIQLLVVAVMTFDTIHQILITHTVYIYTITHWGDPAELQVLVWSLLVEVIFNGLTAFLVQSFLAMRVWRLSNRNLLLTGLVMLLVLAEFGAVIAFSVLGIPMDTFVQLATLKSLSISVNALAAAGDVLIAGSLCILLHFSRTGFHRSDTMINKLILFSVNTGLLTSFCAIASLVSIVVAGNTFIYIGFFFCLGRLYTNSLLATLNARKKIRAAGSQTTSELSRDISRDIALSLRQFSNPASMAGSRCPPNISIKIDTTQEFASDQKLDSTDKTETMGSSVQGDEEKAMQSTLPTPLRACPVLERHS